MNLLNDTYALLENTEKTYREIAKGADVSFNWLIKFAAKSIPSPGVLLVQRVHDFLLTGRKLAKRTIRRRSQSRVTRMREAANA